jgi:hypothetical protein
MSRILKKKSSIILFIALIGTGLILLHFTFITTQSFLSKTQKVKANVLVVEGWLPKYAIELVCKEFHENNYDHIITTGIKSSDLDYCPITSNGYLIFYPHFISTLNNDNGHHTIEVTAHSTMSGKYCAHFNFYVNNMILADFNADKKDRKYSINWEGSLKDIDSVMIQFDNDYLDKYGDRNLFVKEIIIDHKMIIPYQFNSELDFGLLDGKERIVNNFDSKAELWRNELIAYGIDPKDVTAVPAKKVYINRTLTSALAFRSWLKLTNIKVKGINIISLGVHSRRTWNIYKKMLGKSIEVGIISLPENGNNIGGRPKILAILYEVIGIIYYQIIFNYIPL